MQTPAKLGKPGDSSPPRDRCRQSPVKGPQVARHPLDPWHMGVCAARGSRIRRSRAFDSSPGPRVIQM